MRTVMVVGGAGFIGSQLCDLLLENGDRVVCVDNLMRGKKENLLCIDNENFLFFIADASDQNMMSELMTKYEVSYVFHLAANSDIQASAMDPTIEFDCTLSTTWSLLFAMRENRISKMFFASTSAVYGNQCDVLLEEDTSVLQPISYYGASKMASEAYIHAFAHMNNMDICIFRFANVIGPRLTHGVIYDFIGKLKKNSKKLEVLGNGTQCKPYIHSSDLLKAIMQMHNHVTSVEIFNVGVESDTTVSRIAEIVRNEMGLPDAELCYGEGSIGWKGDVPRFKFSLDKIHQTGWHATMTSDEAVIATVREVLKCKL